MKQDPFANLDKKTFRQAIIELLESEYKLLGSHKILELIAEDIVELEYKYHPRKKTNKFGSLSWLLLPSRITSPNWVKSVKNISRKLLNFPMLQRKI